MDLLQTKDAKPGIIGLQSPTSPNIDDPRILHIAQAISFGSLPVATALLETLNVCFTEWQLALTSSHPAYLDVVTQPPTEHVNQSPLDALFDLSQEDWKLEAPTAPPNALLDGFNIASAIRTVFDGRWLSGNVRVVPSSEPPKAEVRLSDQDGVQESYSSVQPSQFQISFVSARSLGQSSESDDGSDSIPDQWENLVHQVSFALTTSALMGGGPQCPVPVGQSTSASSKHPQGQSSRAGGPMRSIRAATANHIQSEPREFHSVSELKRMPRCQAVCDFDLGFSGRAIELSEKVPNLELAPALPMCLTER